MGPAVYSKVSYWKTFAARSLKYQMVLPLFFFSLEKSLENLTSRIGNRAHGGQPHSPTTNLQRATAAQCDWLLRCFSLSLVPLLMTALHVFSPQTLHDESLMESNLFISFIRFGITSEHCFRAHGGVSSSLPFLQLGRHNRMTTVKFVMKDDANIKGVIN